MQQNQPQRSEIDLIDIFQILWQRKIMIISLPLLLTIAAGVLIMTLPKTYMVSAIIEPAKGAGGNPVELSETIKGNILGGAYDQQVLENNGLESGSPLEWKVQVPSNTLLINISLESEDPQLAVNLLNELISLFSMRIGEKLLAERQHLDNRIKSALINHKGLQKSIKLLIEQTRVTTDKIGVLESARRAAMASRTSDAMSILLYASEIQSRQSYLNNLQLQLKDARQNVESAALEVDTARVELSRLKEINIAKRPTVSKFPVKPKKMLILSLAFMLGLVSSTMLAFLQEYVQRVGKQE